MRTKVYDFNYEDIKFLPDDMRRELRLYQQRTIKVKNTYIKRTPKKGEIYISGSIPAGYVAPNDLTTEFYIGKLVIVERVLIEKIIREF